ncbi:MAG TPA: TonB-dependent receptor plug domain-containing protein, partial [Puia sp.]
MVTIACLQVSAASYSQKVNLSVRQEPLDKVFRAIKAQTGYVFWYKVDILKHSRPVTLQLREVDLGAALDSIFRDEPLSYEIVDRTIAVRVKEGVEAGAVAPPVTVTGRVVDEKGLPVPGVTIQVKGVAGGVTTDGEGVFRMPGVAENAVLSFSSVGYQSQELRLGGRTTVNIVLHSESQSLGDMVVVGYGRASRRSLSSSITTVKADELNRGAITDVGQLLQGKAPGLNVTASGDPNKPAAVILRGASTINSPGGPFYVIDGVPGADISTVAPDDIATIDILKDAAATAIYGNRAANGLIMITTKRGKKGQTQVNYDGYVGTEQVNSRVEVMNAPQLRAFLAKNNLGFSATDDLGANTDWQKAIERNTAVSTNHNLSFSGGGDHTTYSATVNYVKKEGIIRNTDLSRVIGRLAIDQYALNDHLKFSLNLVNSYSDGDELPYLGVILLQAAHYLPVSPVKNRDG